MNLRRIKKHNVNKGDFLIALIFLFVSFASAQSEYPINDPRNPKCPCHKYQQQAEEEYKQLLAQNNSVSYNKEIKVNNDQKFGEISDDVQGKTHRSNSRGNLTGNTDQINLPDFAGISSDDLARINISQVDNVLGLINDEPGELKASQTKINRTGSFYPQKHRSTTAHWKGKRKKHSALHKQLKRFLYVASWDIWKPKRITSACYHWK